MPSDTSDQQPQAAPSRRVVEEYVPENTDSTFGTINPPGSDPNQPPANMPSVVSPPPQSKGVGRTIPVILGILFLVGAVAAGVFLVQQQQDLREKAAPAEKFCGNVNQPICNANDFCWYATTVNQCLVNGQPEGSTEYFGGNSTWDGQVCYNCPNEAGNPVRCSAGTKVGGDPAKCGGGGGGGGGATPTPAPTQKACGQTCSSDSECYPTGATGAPEKCINNMCVNANCPTQTVPGRNCDCSTLNACGQRCGRTVGLCQAGSECGFTTTPDNCNHIVDNNLPGQYCLPLTPTHGYSISNVCSGIQARYLTTSTGAVATTQAQVFEACSAEEQNPTGQCSGVKIYDTNWVELTTAQLTALKPGDKVRLTALGTTNVGQITQARFTVNGTTRASVTQKKPTTGEFYDEYTIPAGLTTFTVKGEVFHSTLGWF